MTKQQPQLKFYFGDAVDSYLEREGAIAQAVDRDTIVLSSSVFALPRAECRTIILHELAHVEQLAGGGSDPVGALEDEAWEAAEAWSAGKPFAIRGRARTRLNAVAIIQGGEHGKMAAHWYKSNPVEPIGGGSNVTVKSTVVLEDSDNKHLTLEDFLDAIIEKKEKEVVIVCHGTDQGLMPHLYKGSDYASEGPNLVRLGSDQPFQRGGIITPTIADDKVFAGASTENIKRIRGKMKKVRDMQLDHVAFRACDMGASTDTLDAFRDFFGAKSVSAPKIKDVYGSISPTVGSDFKTWANNEMKLRFKVWIDKSVAIAFKQDGSLKFTIKARAMNKNVLSDWGRAHVSAAATGATAFYFHGMYDPSVVNKDTPVVYFIRDQSFLSNLVNYAG